jgi:hypothetical protein
MREVVYAATLDPPFCVKRLTDDGVLRVTKDSSVRLLDPVAATLVLFTSAGA